MTTYNVLGFVISLLLAFVGYFATSNLFIGGGILVVSIAFHIVLISKPIKKYLCKSQKLHECYLFINNFLISLSIKQSLNAAFETTSVAISDEYKDYLNSVSELRPEEKLLYLQKYFPFHIFRLFTEIVFLWLDQGGRILEMSSYITNEAREIEEYLTYCHSINKRRAIEIGVLWFFSLGIVAALRLALQDLYTSLTKNMIFLVSIAAFMLVVLFSLFLLVNRITKLEIRGLEDGK